MNQEIEQTLLRGMDLMQTGKVAEAEIIFHEVIRKHPDTAEAHQLLGLIYAAREDFIKAQECFKQAVSIEPDNAAYNSNYANTLQDTWMIEESLPFYQKAIDLKPDFVDAHFNMGNSFRKLQRFPEALKCYALAKKSTPSTLSALLTQRLSTKLRKRLIERLLKYLRD